MPEVDDTPSGARPGEAFTTFRDGALAARVGFRVTNEAVYAGGPLVLSFVVENIGTEDFFLAAGGSRATHRPDFFAFEAVLRDLDLPLGDPLHKAPDLGGPVGSVRIAPGESTNQTLFLNQFLSLERVHDALKPGESALLTVVARHPFPLARTAEEALQIQPNAYNVESTLDIFLVRDDQRLEELIEALSNTIRMSWTPHYSAELDLALGQLASLRIPLALPHLRSLQQHPNGSIRTRARRALDDIEKGTSDGPDSSPGRTPNGTSAE
jgi:hypothetical protein